MTLSPTLTVASPKYCPLLTGAVMVSSRVYSVVSRLFWDLSTKRAVSPDGWAVTESCFPSFTGTESASGSWGAAVAKLEKP